MANLKKFDIRLRFDEVLHITGSYKFCWSRQSCWRKRPSKSLSGKRW